MNLDIKCMEEMLPILISLLTPEIEYEKTVNACKVVELMATQKKTIISILKLIYYYLKQQRVTYFSFILRNIFE
jgi:hypothetical protein